MMVIQGARALMIQMKRDQSRMGLWLREVAQRSHPHVALIALANKIVRICWKVLTSQQSYRPFVETPQLPEQVRALPSCFASHA
jgi:transposase